MQTWETCKYTQLCTCGKSQFPSDPGPHLTRGQEHQLTSMELFSWVEGNLIHTYVDTHTYTHHEWAHTHRATPSHTPTLQTSVNVRLWECGFILERYGIFTPFITPSHTNTHTHTHIGSSYTAHPIKGKPWPRCSTSLCKTQNYQNTWTFMLWEILSCSCKVLPHVKIGASVHKSKWLVTQLETLEGEKELNVVVAVVPCFLCFSSLICVCTAFICLHQASSTGDFLTSSALYKHLIWMHSCKRVYILWIDGLSFTER